MKKYIFGIITGVLLAGGITAYASGLISGDAVSFNNSNTGLTSTNVNGALEELYGIMDTHCPTDYKCTYLGTCNFEIGEEWDFNYTGAVQKFEIPCTGLYKLEVWGASGGSCNTGGAAATANGGKGGYSVNYVTFSQGQFVYVGVGEGGVYNGGDSPTFNGGGAGYTGSSNRHGQGGGATHIALVTGTIADIGYESFVTQGNGLIVAGGGGGGFYDYWSSDNNDHGGAGGGAIADSNSNTSRFGVGAGGTQISGYAFGQGQLYGGGGLYGGKSPGGGGSGYVKGSVINASTGTITEYASIKYDNITYTASMQKGVNSGNGKAKITLIAR